MEVQYISLNMTPTGVNPCFHISQYDVGRMLGFIVHSGGATVDLDTYTCTIEATRSDGTAITSAVATNDNIGTFEVTPTMSNKADKYRCQLVIIDANSKRIASLPFDMDVTKAAMDENSEGIEEDASLYQQYTEAVQGAIADANANIQAEENARIAAVSAEATARADAITAEATARANADITLQNNIDAEATARQTADNTLQGNINSEASARASADSNLQSQINQIVAPSGEAPSAAEVQNARIGADGVTYDTLGTAIRSQVSELKGDLNNQNIVIDDVIHNGKYDVKNICMFENGSILSNGIDADSGVATYPYSIRTKGYFSAKRGKIRIVPNGYYIALLWYSDTNGSLVGKNIWITSEYTQDINPNYYYRICIYDYVNKKPSDLLWVNEVSIEIEDNTISADIEYLKTNVNKQTVITVGATGCDYTSLVDAIEQGCVNSSENNVIDVMLSEGEYNLLDDYDLTTKDKTWVGLTLPDYVNIIGIGSPKNTKIIMRLPINISSTVDRNVISTLNFWRNNIIKNITVIGKNCRYAVHNDDFKKYAVNDANENIENCHFIFEPYDDGIKVICGALGSGAYNGRKTKIKNCIFDNQANKGYSVILHNNIDSPKHEEWDFECCNIKGGQYAINVSSAGSGQTEIINLKGCKLEQNIMFTRQSSYTDTKSEFVIYGYGNKIPNISYSDIVQSDEDTILL